MTYKATSLNVERALKCGFVKLEPIRPIAKERRSLLVAPEVKEVFDGGRDGDIQGFPVGCDQLVASFLAGSMVRVSRVREKRKRGSDICVEQLADQDEVWAFCVRKPPPGWRFFGRFLERDILVLFTAFNKADQGEKYEGDCEHVREQWKECFGEQQPVCSDDIGDYLSGPIFDVDQEC